MKKKTGLTLGVDCGGTNLKLALVEKSGKILESELVPVSFKEEPPAVVRKMGKTLKDFLKKHKAAHIQSVGMGIAGEVDPQEGIVRFSPNMGWKNIPVKKWLSKDLGVPILVENDANAAAWGAYCLDARQDCENLVCLTLGTGVGGGIIIHRKLYRGSTGSAGEVGHMTIDFRGRKCRCGNYGCIESMIGAWGLIQTAEEGLKKKQAPVLAEILRRSPKAEVSPKLISEAADKGDSFCQHVWTDAGEKLGCALANLVNLFNPDRIILAGGVSKVGSRLLAPALHTLGARAFETPAKKVKISVSKFDSLLGVVGAALLYWE